MLQAPQPVSSAALAALPTRTWTLARIADGTAVVVLLVLAAIAIATFRDYGLGWDDYTHSQYGDLLLSLYSSGFTDRRALSFVNLYMYGGGFDMAAAFAAQYLPFDLFETRRLMGAAVGLIGLVVTWRLGRRLGGPLAGVLALVLLATCPVYYGHSFINTKDAPFAVAMAVLLLGLLRAFEEYPRPSGRTIVLFGIGLGLAFGTRILAGLSVFYGLAALALLVALDSRTMGLRTAGWRSGKFVLALLPGMALAYLVMGFVWPWSILDPLNPIRAAEYFSHFFEAPWREQFGGKLILVPDMPLSYLPTLFALTLPELFLALGLIGIAGALVYALAPSAAKPILGPEPAPAPARRAAFLLVALAAMVPFVFAFVTHPAFYNGIRHFVFLVPPFAVLAGVAAAWLGTRIQELGPAPALIAACVFVAGLALPINDMVRLHPYEYTYFNTLSGGVRHARGRYMVDYWGLSFKEVLEDFHAKLEELHESPPLDRRWKVAVCGPHPPADIALGAKFEVTWESKGADFALMLGEFYCVKLDAPVLAEVRREGVIYARVYDLRGLSIPNILTIPAPQ
ncbi:MAG: ArnT family glycosyltransferase [Xanthobacteraceae bacterium]